MKFPYKRFARGAFPPAIRPIITIKLSHDDRTLRQEVLVDSGADICLFDAEIGELLGIRSCPSSLRVNTRGQPGDPHESQKPKGLDDSAITASQWPWEPW